jgi:hypothetical protein
MVYPVIEVDPESVVSDEQLGSKDKFWFEYEGQQWLFKEARVIHSPHGDVVTGEDWAEKAAAEIAQLIGVQAAHVQLAEYKGKRGCASLNFLPDRSVHLEHGNEILGGRVLGYDRTKRQKQTDHTIENIVAAIRKMFDKQAANAVLSQLASYLVLDALICNTDRHHENWGLFWRVLRTDEPVDDWDKPVLVKQYDVAPSFDHASSLGRELLDERRERILAEGRMAPYVRNGQGGVYWRSTDRKGANPLRLIESASSLYPEFFLGPIKNLSALPVAVIQEVMDEIPADRISQIARHFAKEMLATTYMTLIGLNR